MAGLAALLSCTGGEAGVAPIQEPQMLRLQVTDTYIGMQIESEHEKATFAGSDKSATYSRLFESPIFGLKTTGSVYHPKLLTFSINGEVSPGFTTEQSAYTTTTRRKEYRELGNYYANCTLLAEKPYRSTLYLSQNYTYRDYDFFNRVHINILNYGGNTGYQAGPVPFNIKVWQRSEDSFGQTINTSLRETGFGLDARNTRESGETSFTYLGTSHDLQENNLQASGTENAFGVSDAETFGAWDQIQFNTTTSYASRKYTDLPTDEFNTMVSLTDEHTPTLSSLYDANYTRLTSDFSGASADTSNLHGGISLRHQLFESLASTLRFQGQDFTTNGTYQDTAGRNLTSSTEMTRYGGGVSESYSKRLGSFGVLTMMGSVLLEHSVQTNNGSVIIQTDESHRFTAGSNSAGTDAFFLNLPYVDQGSIVVTDERHTMPAYQEGIDYTISRNGFLTMIRRTPISTIPANSAVLVNYRAEASPSGSSDTITGLSNMRIDLWNGLAAFYYRLNSVQNSGTPGLILQDINLSAIGAESSWRWLRVGVEHETNASTFSSYSDVRFFQSLAFKPDVLSTLNFDFLEAKMHYVDSNRNEDNYSFTARYQRVFSRSLGMRLDAGVSERHGIGVDQTLATVRPSVEFVLGRLSLKAGYSYEYGKYAFSDERLKTTLFFSGHRSF